MFPEELKGLSPVEEKLIALNSCYGIFTRHAVSTAAGQRQSIRYPRHIKGHVTVFPNNVQDLTTKVLPHPLLKVMDEIHVSWQGPEKPTPVDLSVLLSVRRRVVERALVWLKRNNPLYADVEIDEAEMDTWRAPVDGVPAIVYDRMERYEPSAWEKTRTAHVVPATERGLDDEGAVDIDDVLASLDVESDPVGENAERQEPVGNAEAPCAESGGSAGAVGQLVNEVTSSGMFALDGVPDVADVEKFHFACQAVRGRAGDGLHGVAGPTATLETPGEETSGADKRHEAFIRISRGDDFADSSETAFFAKAFPTLFPFGVGGPKLAEEGLLHVGGAGASAGASYGRMPEAEAVAGALVASRNLHLRAWADIVLRRHGGRFSTHHIFAFLVFNMGVRSRNRRVSMLSVARRNFNSIERIVRSMTAERLAAASAELESTGKTSDDGVRELLRSLSVYGHRQPMSREVRLNMRRKIQSSIVAHGVPAIWFTLNPNDITNPVKLRLAAYRTRDPHEAEAFLESLGNAYKRTRLAISDPMSSAIFFHREMTLFFEKYVKVGEESVFGRISHYFGAVETNERGALHIHGLLWLHGNAQLASVLADVNGEGAAAYKEGIIRYVDSVFSEDLDAEAFCAVQAERSAVSDISSKLYSLERSSSAFDEEANFCAGATQIHTHSATCLKYSLGRARQKGGLCRFKAPWKLVEETAFTDEGILKIRRTHPLVNRWNKAIAVGLRHNHDISFIATQKKTLALIYYVTNYSTKVEDPTWKRAAAAAELLPSMSGDNVASEGEPATQSGSMIERPHENRTRQFLMKVANRVFTERPLSQVEVVAHLLGYPAEFSNSNAWAYLNTSLLYWQIFRRWRHLRDESGAAVSGNAVDESVVVEEAGYKLGHVEAYEHRGPVLRDLCLYDYVSIVRLKRCDSSKAERAAGWGEIPFEDSWRPGKTWIQVLRRPGKHATVCLDGYLSKDFTEVEEDEICHRRAAVQHLALFVPWNAFLRDEVGDINDVWTRARRALSSRISCLIENVQLLRRSAEDARRDAKQWAASSGDGDAMVSHNEEGDAAEASNGAYEASEIGDATRLIDVVRNALSPGQVTADSAELRTMVQQLSRFQQASLGSAAELEAAAVPERGIRRIGLPGAVFTGAAVPSQDQVRAIKAQQMSTSREKERMIQGIQSAPAVAQTDHGAAVRGALSGFGDDNLEVAATDTDETEEQAVAEMEVQVGPSSSFLAAGKDWARRLTLNKRQSIAFLIICRHLDMMHGNETANAGQLCQFVGGEGGTGKSRVIEALVGLFAARGISNRLLITATSGTAAARINGITIHSACGFTKDQGTLGGNASRGVDGVSLPKQTERFVNGQSRMDWQEKDVLVIDEVSMLGARTLHAVNEQLCRLRGSQRDFGGTPIVLFCGDFHQFRPVQERSILLPSAAISWDVDNSFEAEQRHQHDNAHALWSRFTTVVMLNEQMRAAGDPELQRLLTRIRRGEQDHADLDFLNARCYREGRRIPWETGITVVTPLNRNRWNLNMEASVAFRAQERSAMRIFISEHKWKDGVPTEEEAIMILNQGDDSAIPVPAVFMFVPGMPVVVNRNTYQGLKVTNGGAYTAVDVVVNKAFPGHRVSAGITVHFGPPAGIILASETTRDLHFVGMPPGTVLLTPMSVRIARQRKRPWQRTDVSRKGLPCTAAFACTDYKVQGRSLDRVALELRGTRTMNIEGRVVPAQCDPYSLYVQLSRCRTLDGIMLVSKVRERDLVANRVPPEMTDAQSRLDELSEKTLREAACWLGGEPLSHNA
ncbi:ATP-dependent DNA helicase PIF1 [Purpureocillium lilacinum]|uniref:ATP-dependent DNA helicase n=1 Tax=Purpureocillium lilacinum TaxID=33203 RepID=A0A179F6T1_PURLI|nr:ATP-dependent DNA helicase PIF1 [Purpureocillium lilacinum]OAQ60809.1 ATP-dependent DNA helicase PIF1 [Purpureocillium lilacinum]